MISRRRTRRSLGIGRGERGARERASGRKSRRSEVAISPFRIGDLDYLDVTLLVATKWKARPRFILEEDHY